MTVEHPRMGPLKMPGVVPRMQGTPAPPIKAAPLLGEHTEEVLRTLLGKSEKEIEQLRHADVV